MVETSVITAEMRQAIGSVLNVTITPVERGWIKELVETAGDDNPLWSNEEQARRSSHAGIVAPPGLIFCRKVEGGRIEDYLPFEEPLKRGLAAEQEWEFFQTVRPGDIIIAVRKLADLYEKKGKLGNMLFMVFEITFVNQRSEVVAKGRASVIRY